METYEGKEMKTVLALLRIKSWIKNGFLFLPAIFSFRLLQLELMSSLFLGALAFSLVSSFVYVTNDIKDSDRDALHPRKKNQFLIQLLILCKANTVFISFPSYVSIH